MNLNFLEFEQPIAELEAKIEELRRVSTDSEVNLAEEIERLEKKNEELTRSIFANLNTWQKVQLARHPLRPYTLDYIEHLFADFDELHGDRHISQGPAIVCGIARFNDRPVAVIGHQKGRTTKEKLFRNFGMPRPEEYQKALRIMKMAEKFRLPIFTFIDTPGAYPGIHAEERNQSQAIALNLYEMSITRTPIICTVIGEGGSGGALAIGVGDRVIMLKYSIYSVISPEGCASILWKSAEKASEAAEAMGVTADRIKALDLCDMIVEEPLGGAHRNIEKMTAALKETLQSQLLQLQSLSVDTLLEQRYQRLMKYGVQN